MKTGNGHPNVIVLGAGAAGIAMAHQLRYGLGFDNFMVYEKDIGVGGTWLQNTYPGCGCDVPTQLYSFSWNLKPDWPADLCDQKQILTYMEDTVDKFHLRGHFLFNIECLGAEWIAADKQWMVKIRNVLSKAEFVRYATILINCVGSLSLVKNVPFPGREDFKGEQFHTARWNHNYDITGKRMAIIGNGCSGVQLLPFITDKVASVKHYVRSAQWYHKRPNRIYTNFDKFCFKWVPLYQRYIRLQIYLENDAIVDSYVGTEKARKIRSTVERESTEYILQRAPKKYHDFLIPKFPLGCKRRIFDGGYLDALNLPNVELVNEGIERITENGIIGTSGVEHHFDVIIHATGFRVSEFLHPMEIIGTQGISLADTWRQNGGVQAYYGCFVHDFPNLGILLGPNTVPAHGSAIFAAETTALYCANKLVAPIIDGRADVVEVKQAAENEFAARVHRGLEGAVFQQGCSNWYSDVFGRNVAHWHSHGRTFLFETLLPQGNSFLKMGGSELGMLKTIFRWIRTTDAKVWIAVLLILTIGRPSFLTQLAGPYLRKFSGSLQSSFQSLRLYVSWKR